MKLDQYDRVPCYILASKIQRIEVSCITRRCRMQMFISLHIKEAEPSNLLTFRVKIWEHDIERDLEEYCRSRKDGTGRNTVPTGK